MSNDKDPDVGSRTHAKRLGADEANVLTFSSLKFEEFFIPEPSKEVVDSYHNLRFDKHTKGDWNFRRRAYSNGLLNSDGRINWSTDSSFFQAKHLNSYAGNIIREFEPLSQPIRDYIGMMLNCEYYRILRQREVYRIGVHQIRTQCNDDNLGFPVPEGYHQDGFDFVGTHCLANENASGGTSFLRLGKKDGPCVFEKDLGVMRGLVFDDRSYFHYVSPIFTRESRLGYRDMIVVTFLKNNN